jgi:hypothetical protein
LFIIFVIDNIIIVVDIIVVIEAIVIGGEAVEVVFHVIDVVMVDSIVEHGHINIVVFIFVGEKNVLKFFVGNFTVIVLVDSEQENLAFDVRDIDSVFHEKKFQIFFCQIFFIV